MSASFGIAMIGVAAVIGAVITACRGRYISDLAMIALLSAVVSCVASH